MTHQTDLVNDHGKLKGLNAKAIPSTIVAAVSLIFIASLYGIGVAILVLAEANEIVNGQLIRNINIVIDATSSSSLEAELLAHTLYGYAVYSLIIGVLGMFFGYLVLTGREWARIAASVLFGVGILASLGRLTGTTHLMWIDIIFIVVQVAIIWAMWATESTAYFRKNTAAAQGQPDGE